MPWMKIFLHMMADSPVKKVMLTSQTHQPKDALNSKPGVTPRSSRRNTEHSRAPSTTPLLESRAAPRMLTSETASAEQLCHPPSWGSMDASGAGFSKESLLIRAKRAAASMLPSREGPCCALTPLIIVLRRKSTSTARWCLPSSLRSSRAAFWARGEPPQERRFHRPK